MYDEITHKVIASSIANPPYIVFHKGECFYREERKEPEGSLFAN